MQFQLPIEIKKLPDPISYKDKILLVGSCFTEHIGNALEELKFSILQNPNGILFDPASVCNSLVSYIQNKKYSESDFFQLNEVWHSWQHHSRYSNINLREAVHTINKSQQKAHDFLKAADWIIITLGSAFSYRFVHEGNPDKQKGGQPVANCHRAPAQWFEKHLMEASEIISMLDNCYHQLQQFNPKLNIIFTISPVRHVRDGVIDNNRSKARLIEAVHTMVNKFDKLYYFPAYELVIDILRDYRFYDIDMVHPNYQATEFVMEKFSEACIDEVAQQVMKEIKSIIIAKKHRAFQPETKAHQQFLSIHLEKTKDLIEKYPFLDLQTELSYFSKSY